jgi:zinc protease
MLSFAITSKLYGLPPDYWDAYPAKIMAVSADDVQRVARAYLNPDTLQLVAVGDAGRIKAALEKYGAVEVFEAAGTPRAGAPTP